MTIPNASSCIRLLSPLFSLYRFVVSRTSGEQYISVFLLERPSCDAWKEVAVHPPLSTGPPSPAGAAQEEHLLLLRNATAAGLLDLCTCWFVSVYIRSQNAQTRRLWRAGRGKRGKMDLSCCFYHPSWQLLGWRLGWKDYCCGWLLLDLPAISRMLCSVAVSGVMLPTVSDICRRNKHT